MARRIKQPEHSLKAKHNPEEGSSSLQCMRTGRGEEATEGKLEGSRGWLMRLGREAISITSSADRQAAASYPDDTDKIIKVAT